ELRSIEGLELRRLDPARLLGGIRSENLGLDDIYGQLTQPAGRANVLRAAILRSEGGIYLDMDTITVAELGPLAQQAGAFVGLEHIALPHAVRASKNPFVWAAAVGRRGVRDAFRRLPHGWRGFRRIERFYPAAANNAVLASAPEHPLLVRLTQAMLELDEATRLRRFALGTHLLQRVLAVGTESDVRQLDARYFYPLGPEISEHWFRMTERAPAVDEVLFPETLVVHWYASVRTANVVPLIDRAYVEQNAGRQLFSALALRVLRADAGPAGGAASSGAAAASPSGGAASPSGGAA
ncbi:MAG TPA: glycosyltransferase, partial [Polyangiaceae bacterium]|nr:glycosyltransferase [Polyangiaceae bacterium]